MKANNGKSRAVIENLYPELECGHYPIKRVVGERVYVSADIFGDGHDEVRAVILYRPKDQYEWKQAPMQVVGIDQWKGYFRIDRKTDYVYTVQAWIDHFTSWQKGLKKKYADSQDLSIEFEIGARMVEQAIPAAEGNDISRLGEFVNLLRNRTSVEEAVEAATSAELSVLIYQYLDRANATTYGKELTVRVELTKALFSTWYEFFPRSASEVPGQHGTFADCERLLPHIADMGFDVIYLPPIHPIGRSFRKGKNNSTTSQPGEPGSCWAIGAAEGGHKSILSELGTLDDFIHFVRAAKGHNIDIAMDIAFQCSPDHPYVQESPQWFKWRPDGTVQYAENPPKKYQDVLPINFETEDWENLWEELKSVFMYWIEQGVTIFRVDNPHTKPFPFWKWVIKEIQKEHPDVIFLSEAFTRRKIMQHLAKIGFTQSYTYFTWRNNKHELTQYMEELTTTEEREYFRPNFWPNTPDILPKHLQFDGNNIFVIRFILAATLSSNYGFYGPAFEQMWTHGMFGKEEYHDSEKYEIKYWDWTMDTPFKRIIRAVNKIRKENVALQTTYNIQFTETENEKVIGFIKTSEDMTNKLLIVINLDSRNTQKTYVKVPLASLEINAGDSYRVRDLILGEEYSWRDEWHVLDLDPYELPFRIFSINSTVPYVAPPMETVPDLAESSGS